MVRIDLDSSGRVADEGKASKAKQTASRSLSDLGARIPEGRARVRIGAGCKNVNNLSWETFRKLVSVVNVRAVQSSSRTPSTLVPQQRGSDVRPLQGL